MRREQFTIRDLLLLSALVASVLGAYRCLVWYSIQRLGTDGVNSSPSIGVWVETAIMLMLGSAIIVGYAIGSCFGLRIRGALIGLAAAFVALLLMLSFAH